MGSSIQVECLIGSLPLAVLTQRCARTVELTGRGDYIQPSFQSIKLRNTRPTLRSNDLFDLALIHLSQQFLRQILIKEINAMRDGVLETRHDIAFIQLKFIVKRHADGVALREMS
jgi:hypothetical protein